MDSLAELLVKLQPYPGLRDELSLSQLWKFITHAALLKKDISLAQHAKHDPSSPPPFLPPVVQTYLSQLLNLNEQLVEECWNVLQDIVWNDDYVAALQEDPEVAFRSFGIQHGLSVFYYTFQKYF